MRFVSPLLQATVSGKGEPAIQIKWLNSPECYMLSTRRIPPWFVLISEYKSMGNKARRESGGSPWFVLVCRMASPQCCVTCFMLFFCTNRYVTSLSQGLHVGFSIKQVIDILIFSPGDPWVIFETNLLHIRTDLPLLSLSTPTESITRQIIYGNENPLFSSFPPSLQWEPRSH